MSSFERFFSDFASAMLRLEITSLTGEQPILSVLSMALPQCLSFIFFSLFLCCVVDFSSVHHQVTNYLHLFQFQPCLQVPQLSNL